MDVSQITPTMFSSQVLISDGRSKQKFCVYVVADVCVRPKPKKNRDPKSQAQVNSYVGCESFAVKCLGELSRLHYSRD